MQPVRYIPANDVSTLLRDGCTLQQWVCVLERNGFRFIRWVELNASGDAFSVYEHESLDSGPHCRDMTSFACELDPDFPEGVRHKCKSAEEALALCERFGCRADRFLKHCDIQLEYDAYVESHGPPERDAREYFIGG